MSITPNRIVLSPKPTNISSPIKAAARSPLRKIIKTSPKKRVCTAPAFQIWEDKKPQLEVEVEIHHDQENILQPKKIQPTRSNRRVLQPLNIKQFPGFITYTNSQPQKLTELYQPKNFDNINHSMHKFTKLPNYVTPPRSSSKYLVKTNLEDDLELKLINKSLHLKKRSMSVGKNDLKANLIRKNGFKIGKELVI